MIAMYIEKVPNRNSPPAVLRPDSYREGDQVKKRTPLMSAITQCYPSQFSWYLARKIRKRQYLENGFLRETI